MKRLPLLLFALLVLFVLFVLSANATEDVVLLSVTLQQTPCAAEVQRHIPPQARERFLAGQGRYWGIGYALCWAPDKNAIVVVWEDGWVILVGRQRTQGEGV
ncbi:MAG: hypothetical protein NUV51_03955 [Sulfuricaulis sp.]|nr:hypothetical protein [Sulfuricaulis sp.]